MKKIFYYEDELNDDFGQTVKGGKPLPKNYKYVGTNVFFKLFEFFIYRIIIRPIAWLARLPRDAKASAEVVLAHCP